MNLVNLLANSLVFFTYCSSAIAAIKTADIYASQQGVRIYAPDTGAGTSLVNSSSSAETVYGIAHDAATETVFWSSLSGIYKANARKPTELQIILNTTECQFTDAYGSIQGLALDDTTGDLYGAGENGSIFACNGTRTIDGNDTPACSTVFHDQGTLYGELALSPNDRLIHDTRYASYMGEIRRVGMNGLNPAVLLQTGSNVPAGIALDSGSSRLYWAEHYPGLIQSCDLKGTNPELLGWFGYTHGIAVSGDRVYCTDPLSVWLTSSLMDGGDARLKIYFGLELYHLAAVGRRAAAT